MPYITDFEEDDQKCRFCDAERTEYRIWESSDGGHEDINRRCKKCGKEWWIDGCDS